MVAPRAFNFAETASTLQVHFAYVSAESEAINGSNVTLAARPTPESKGLLERLNGFPSYNALTNHLKTATGRYYGSPMLTFIESLMEEDAIKRRFDIELEKAK
ncbi:hypothetical protein FACS189472_12600 [Alphaproteobacteria bacterium]|nr:hypothetical protein FACS189472_12600 [Alphaproteobacteria bacterium]